MVNCQKPKAGEKQRDAARAGKPAKSKYADKTEDCQGVKNDNFAVTLHTMHNRLDYNSIPQHHFLQGIDTMMLMTNTSSSILGRNVGIGAEFTIRADTKIWKYAFGQLADMGIAPIEPEDAHVTLIDPSEALFPLETLRDSERLAAAEAAISQHLSKPGISRFVFEGAVEIKPLPFKRRLFGVVLVEQDFCTYVRGTLAGMIYDTAKVEVTETRPYVAHMRLGTRREEYGKLKRDAAPLFNPYTPNEIEVNGFKITHHESLDTFEVDDELDDNPPRYTNSPKVLRRP